MLFSLIRNNYQNDDNTSIPTDWTIPWRDIDMNFWIINLAGSAHFFKPLLAIETSNRKRRNKETAIWACNQQLLIMISTLHF